MRSFLLNLIRSSILGKTDFEFPESVDWEGLIREADRQGVSVIASDGLQKLYDQGLYSAKDGTELRRMKARWFGKTMQYEQRYESQKTAARKMEKWLAQDGIQTVVLKGFTVSECYPIPSHRYSADLDCFLIKEGEHFDTYELGNKVLEAHGIKVDRSYYKNSSFDLPGLHVENHKFCTPFRGNTVLRRFEELLQQLLLEGPSTPLADTGLLEPPPLFSALFLTEHAYSHFLHEGLTLRHVLDWALFRRRHSEDVDWEQYGRYCEEFGFSRFAEALEQICDHVLFESPLTDNRFMDDIWSGPSLHGDKKGLALRLSITRNTLRSGWKYRAFSNLTMVQALWIQVKGFFFDRNPKL